MADGKKFDIELGTTADTSGLEATERALRDVETAGKAAANPMGDGSQLAAAGNAEAVRETTAAVDDQRAAVDDLTEANGDLERQQADVAEAQKRASDRRVADQEKELLAEKDAQQAAQDSARARLAAGAALAASAKIVAGLTVDVIRQYRELGVELRGFESIGLEFADFLTSPFEYVTDAFTDYKADLAALKASQLEVIRQEQNYQETVARRDALLAAMSQRRVSVYLAGEESAINAQTAALERQLRVMQAISAQEEARARAADAVALAAGADPNQVAAGAAARRTAAASVQADGRVAAAEQEVENAIRRFDVLGSALAQASTAAVRDEAAIQALSDQTQAAQAAVGDAQAELETIRVEAAAAKSEIASGAVAEFQGLATAAADANTRAAEEAKSALAAQAAEQGASFTAGGREALQILTDVLADGVVKPEELSAVTLAINQAKNASSQLNADVIAGFQNLEKSNTATIGALSEIIARQRAQAAQIERLQLELR